MISDLFALELRPWILIAVVFFVALNDLRQYRISNRSVLATLAAGLAWSASQGSLGGLGQSLLGILVGFLLLIILYAIGGVTAGDVKWLAALGAWYGPKGIVGVFLVSGGILGILSLGLLAYSSIRPVKTGWGSPSDGMDRNDYDVVLATQGMGIDDVYQSRDRRRRMIPYAVPVALGVLLIELVRMFARYYV